MSDIVERLEGTKHGLYWDVARDAVAEITRLRTLLSEAEQREKDARAKALEEAAKVAEDEDGHFTIWGEDRNTRTSQKTARDIAAAIKALQSEGR